MSGAEDIRAALDHPQPAPVMAEEGSHAGELRGGDAHERPPFPPGSPVTPLGIASGLDGSQACFYLNYNGQLVALEAGNRHGKNSLIALFGPASDWLEANWPQWSKPVYEGRGAARVCIKQAEIIGFDQAEASRALIEECVRVGIFDPSGKMRGVGAHRQRGGGLVLHCGDKLLVSRHSPVSGKFEKWEWRDPGVMGGDVYTAAAPIPRPWHEPVGPECASEFLVKLLMTWEYKRPLLDPRLILGGIGCSILGGWFPWRSNIWITGQRGTGKSTLNGEDGVLEELFGAGQFRTGNASAAAIRQTLANSTVPVMFDEIEAGSDNRRVKEVIELARVSSSGGTTHRGGKDHKAHEFTLRSAFWFSSINIPPMEPQDRSRLAIIELKPLSKTAKAPVLSNFHLPQLGRKLMRRMLDGLWRAEITKARFHEALQAVGHDSRACDQFGTLLACADLLLYDRPGPPSDEEIDEWVEHCLPRKMAEIADEVPDHKLCVDHILTQDVQARGGDERVSLVSWVGDAVTFAMQPLMEQDKGDDQANRRLQELGLKVVNARWNASKGQWGATAFQHEEPGFLAVANNHQALRRFYRDTPWQERGWVRALGRCEGAIERVTTKFGRQSQRSVLVPLWQVLDDDELPNASTKAAHGAWYADWLAEYGDGGGA